MKENKIICGEDVYVKIKSQMGCNGCVFNSHNICRASFMNIGINCSDGIWKKQN